MSEPAPEIIMDARGIYWRRYPDGNLSMVPVSADNDPVPAPLAVYRIVGWEGTPPAVDEVDGGPDGPSWASMFEEGHAMSEPDADAELLRLRTAILKLGEVIVEQRETIARIEKIEGDLCTCGHDRDLHMIFLESPCKADGCGCESFHLAMPTPRRRAPMDKKPQQHPILRAIYTRVRTRLADRPNLPLFTFRKYHDGWEIGPFGSPWLACIRKQGLYVGPWIITKRGWKP